MTVVSQIVKTRKKLLTKHSCLGLSPHASKLLLLSVLINSFFDWIKFLFERN